MDFRSHNRACLQDGHPPKNGLGIRQDATPGAQSVPRGSYSPPKKLLAVERPEIEESPMTPELRDFIDRVIVPILVKEYLVVTEGENDLADDAPGAAHSVSGTSAPRIRNVRP